MKVVMIKKTACKAYEMFELTTKSVVNQNQLEYKSVQAEYVPEKKRSDVFPYFLNIKKETILESWAGTNIRKMSKVPSRYAKKLFL